MAIDGRAPRFDGGLATRLDCIPFGIVVNRHARRFYDEGEDVWPKRYAIWGRLVAQQPGQIACAIVDRKAEELFLPSVYPPIRAETIGELAQKLELDVATLEETVRRFNAACRPGPFDPQALDGCRTEGLDPPKTHWARPLDTPRFTAFPLRPGITFTYLGVKVDENARIGDAGRQARRQSVRRRRDHVRFHPGAGLSGRLRHGDRIGVRHHRRRDRRPHRQELTRMPDDLRRPALAADADSDASPRGPP